MSWQDWESDWSWAAEALAEYRALAERERQAAGSSNGKQRKQLAYLEAAVALGCR